MSWYKPWTWGDGQRLTEGYVSPYGGEIDQHGEHADRFFRALGAQSYRDLSPYTRQRILTEVWYLYSGFSLARRGMDIVAHYATGEGLTYRAQDDAVAEVLARHWNDPVNRWDAKQHIKALELFLYGELFLPVFIEEYTGQVRLGYIDPLQVAAVVTDPENVEIPRWVVLNPTTAGGQASAPSHTSNDYQAQYLDPAFNPDEADNWLRIIQQDDDPDSPTFGLLVGEVHFFAINRVSNCVRGISSLLPVIDWLDIHEQFLMEAAEAAAIKNSVVFDVTISGADQAKLDEERRKLGPIKFGTTRLHNDRVKIETIEPRLGTSELEQHQAMVKRHIAAGLGIPAHWLSEGSEASAATALAMGEPTTKSLRAKQRMFRNVVALILEHQIDQAIIAGVLPADVDKQFKVMTPPIWPTDVQKIGASMLSTAQALMLAVEQGWKSPQEAGRVFDYVADQLGMETSAFSDDTELPASDAGGGAGMQRDGGRMPGLEDMTALQMRRLKDEALGMGRSMRDPVSAASNGGTNGQE